MAKNNLQSLQHEIQEMTSLVELPKSKLVVEIKLLLSYPSAVLSDRLKQKSKDEMYKKNYM